MLISFLHPREHGTLLNHPLSFGRFRLKDQRRRCRPHYCVRAIISDCTSIHMISLISWRSCCIETACQSRNAARLIYGGVVTLRIPGAAKRSHLFAQLCSRNSRDLFWSRILAEVYDAYYRPAQSCFHSKRVTSITFKWCYITRVVKHFMILSEISDNSLLNSDNCELFFPCPIHTWHFLGASNCHNIGSIQ